MNNNTLSPTPNNNNNNFYMTLTILKEGWDFSTFITAKTQMNLYPPFHIKSTWNPPVQPSAVALERYLEDKTG